MNPLQLSLWRVVVKGDSDRVDVFLEKWRVTQKGLAFNANGCSIIHQLETVPGVGVKISRRSEDAGVQEFIIDGTDDLDPAGGEAWFYTYPRAIDAVGAFLALAASKF